MTTMTTPITYAKAATADLRMAAVIQAQVLMQMADTSSLRNEITFVGDVNGSGSDSIRVRYADYGAKTPMAAAADGTDTGASSMDGSVATVTIGRSFLRYDLTDLLVMTSLGRDLDPFVIAEGLAASATARINQIICTTFTNATNSVGTSGVDMSVDDFMNALYQLELTDNPDPSQWLAVLHNRQLADLQASLRAENNNFLAFSPATEVVSSAKAPGLVGSLLGVRIFKSSFVQPDAGNLNYEGMMFSPRGVGYGIGSVPPITGGSEMRPAGAPVTVAFQRDESAGITEVCAHLYCGASILEDSRCVKIVTDK